MGLGRRRGRGIPPRRRLTGAGVVSRLTDGPLIAFTAVLHLLLLGLARLGIGEHLSGARRRRRGDDQNGTNGRGDNEGIQCHVVIVKSGAQSSTIGYALICSLDFAKKFDFLIRCDFPARGFDVFLR